MNNKFSTLLITTRTRWLDGVYEAAKNYDGLMEERLVFEKTRRFLPKIDSAVPSLSKEA